MSQKKFLIELRSLSMTLLPHCLQTNDHCTLTVVFLLQLLIKGSGGSGFFWSPFSGVFTSASVAVKSDVTFSDFEIILSSTWNKKGCALVSFAFLDTIKGIKCVDCPWKVQKTTDKQIPISWTNTQNKTPQEEDLREGSNKYNH